MGMSTAFTEKGKKMYFVESERGFLGGMLFSGAFKALSEAGVTSRQLTKLGLVI